MQGYRLKPSIPLPGIGARAYLPPLASNTLLVPSRLAFLQRSASGTACATRYANACALVCVPLTTSAIQGQHGTKKHVSWLESCNQLRMHLVCLGPRLVAALAWMCKLSIALSISRKRWECRAASAATGRVVTIAHQRMRS